MPSSFTARVTVPDDVLFRQLDQEAVILNLDSEIYFGLDAVGTDMWLALTTSESIQAGYEKLLEEYDVAPETLRADLEELIRKLAADGLLTVTDG
jgi:hypothetical protein